MPDLTSDQLKTQVLATQDLRSSAKLPIALTPSRRAFEAVGFRFGGILDGLLQQAYLPNGWSLQPAKSNPFVCYFIETATNTRRGLVFYKIVGDGPTEARAELNDAF